MYDASKLTNDTLAMMDGASNADMIKAWMRPGGATTGIQNYDLEKPALSLFPVETPFVNKIPVTPARGGSQANWKAITGINTGSLSAGLGEGQRGGVIVTATADYYAKYNSFGLDDYVTEEAELAAEDYMDLVSRAQVNLLYAGKLQMERIYVGGLGTYALGQGNQPTLADVGTGGALAANTTFSVKEVPLNLDVLMNRSLAGGVPGLVSRTNADGSTASYGGGSGLPSANRTVATANDGNATHSISASTASVTGALGYAWFWGAAGAEVLGAITTINSVVIKAAATGTQLASSLTADNSQNNYVCDGLLSMIFKPGFGGYVAPQPTGVAGTGTPLTADGDGGIVEIDAALKYYYDNFRMTPTAIWVSSQEQLNIGKKIAQGPSTGTSNLRFVREAKDGQLIGAVIARAYLNRFAPGISGVGGNQAGTEIPINLHPNIPAGTLMFETERVPFPMAGINQMIEFQAQRPWYATLWPQTTRKKEFGVYQVGVLKNRFIPGFGVITNIGNG